MSAVSLSIRILYCTIAIVCLSGPIIYVLWTGRFRNGIFLIWGLWSFSFFANALLIPVMTRIYHSVHGLVPDADPGSAFFGAVLVGLFGWIPGLIISSFAVVLRDAAIHVWRFVSSGGNNKGTL
jgi:hypothetical protein